MRLAASGNNGSNWTFAVPNAKVWIVKVSTATKLVPDLARVNAVKITNIVVLPN
jgi:hypothetical protein